MTTAARGLPVIVVALASAAAVADLHQGAKAVAAGMPIEDIGG